MNNHGSRHRCGFSRVSICLALGVLVPAGFADAQSSGGSYTLRKHLIGAGVSAQGTPYRMAGSAGQAVAGVASGGSYFVTAGFHQPRLPGPRDFLFCDGFETAACVPTSGAQP